jgi:hypothetical protein
MTVLDDLPTGPRLRPARADADKAELAHVVREASEAVPHLVRRLRIGPLSARATIAGVVVAGALAGGGAAAAVLLSPQRPTVFDEARCYSEASTDFSASFPGTSVAVASAVGSQSGVDVPDQALEACGAVWRQGLLVTGSSGVVQGSGIPDHQVPSLAVCVLPSGEAAVFPGGTGTCGGLGLPPMAPKASGSS